MNPYRYVGNDPINFVDPLGLIKIKVGGKIYQFNPSDHHGVNPPEIHLHDKSTGQKVGAETGQIYDPKGKVVCGKVSKKDFARIQDKLKKLGYLGVAITVYEIYDSITADEAHAFENLLDVLAPIPADRRERMLQEVIRLNPDKFIEVTSP